MSHLSVYSSLQIIASVLEELELKIQDSIEMK